MEFNARNVSRNSAAPLHYDDDPNDVTLPMTVLSIISAVSISSVIISIIFSKEKLYKKESYASIMYFAISTFLCAIGTSFGYPQSGNQCLIYLY